MMKWQGRSKIKSVGIKRTKEKHFPTFSKRNNFFFKMRRCYCSNSSDSSLRDLEAERARNERHRRDREEEERRQAVLAEHMRRQEEERRRAEQERIQWEERQRQRIREEEERRRNKMY